MYEIKVAMSGNVHCNSISKITEPTSNIYIFDLDGTLANIDHRLKYIQGESKDWDMFFMSCMKDAPNFNIISILRALKSVPKGIFENKIWIVTGRSSKVAFETVCWLKQYGIEYDRLFMREEGDHSQDSIMKHFFIESHLSARTKENIVCVFEDRSAVVDMYRKLGITVCQVAKGAY